MRGPTLTPDLCVIGAGSGGLSVAAGAARLGASVVLIEKGEMGGDCLNAGCVPSKSLLAAARAAQDIREAGRFGVHAGEPAVDFAAVMDHVRGVIDGITPMDSQARFESLGVTVLREEARFGDPHTVLAGAHRVRARRFVVAAGSRPHVPTIPGLADSPYLTNETVFALRERPTHLMILGGGPIGCELGQAFRRLGSRVTILEVDRVLGGDDPDMAAVVRTRLIAEGVDLREGWRATSVETRPDDGPGRGAETRLGLTAIDGAGGVDTLTGSHLLVALGRRAALKGLKLASADIIATPQGIRVDDRLRTTNRRVFAIGDVTGGPMFTHMASHGASVVVRQALFRLPARVDLGVVPHVTYTDPELAWVGLTETQALARHHDRSPRVVRWTFAENDRARCERRSEGMVKVVATPRGRVLGAGVVGRDAGELIQPWVMAIRHRIRLGALATMIAPYPTRTEASKRAAGAFHEPALFSERTRRLVRLLSWLG
ncbi:dihydrolipoyl dehydrogenase family protein [Roseospira visakhapatnamensis]|uniref:Pyruvate/2-oxoglutarate dehydrogenase complex dihydrolipoamide dehydrogenase (E3) component n=1 Tax=Roseospira visakhapatnamensis TaxID=390880 RepID=A0A7W6WAI5_9PROT|nr:FAD-dependent oxidoreductase [Roseospira visakhapatnamensis]MBB4267004.1 pyruvate/2-oxoglutarate dehydrogenase complex dihydrolipoamide dehydrogenase (E3) component [Roseospira visakhapatnamensis]